LATLYVIADAIRGQALQRGVTMTDTEREQLRLILQLGASGRPGG